MRRFTYAFFISLGLFVPHAWSVHSVPEGDKGCDDAFIERVTPQAKPAADTAEPEHTLAQLRFRRAEALVEAAQMRVDAAKLEAGNEVTAELRIAERELNERANQLNDAKHELRGADARRFVAAQQESHASTTGGDPSTESAISEHAVRQQPNAASFELDIMLRESWFGEQSGQVSRGFRRVDLSNLPRLVSFEAVMAAIIKRQFDSRPFSAAEVAASTYRVRRSWGLKSRRTDSRKAWISGAKILLMAAHLFSAPKNVSVLESYFIKHAEQTARRPLEGSTRFAMTDKELAAANPVVNGYRDRSTGEPIYFANHALVEAYVKKLAAEGFVTLVPAESKQTVVGRSETGSAEPKGVTSESSSKDEGLPTANHIILNISLAESWFGTEGKSRGLPNIANLESLIRAISETQFKGRAFDGHEVSRTIYTARHRAYARRDQTGEIDGHEILRIADQRFKKSAAELKPYFREHMARTPSGDDTGEGIATMHEETSYRRLEAFAALIAIPVLARPDGDRHFIQRMSVRTGGLWIKSMPQLAEHLRAHEWTGTEGGQFRLGYSAISYNDVGEAIRNWYVEKVEEMYRTEAERNPERAGLSGIRQVAEVAMLNALTPRDCVEIAAQSARGFGTSDSYGRISPRLRNIIDLMPGEAPTSISMLRRISRGEPHLPDEVSGFAVGEDTGPTPAFVMRDHKLVPYHLIYPDFPDLKSFLNWVEKVVAKAPSPNTRIMQWQHSDKPSLYDMVARLRMQSGPDAREMLSLMASNPVVFTDDGIWLAEELEVFDQHNYEIFGGPRGVIAFERAMKNTSLPQKVGFLHALLQQTHDRTIITESPVPRVDVRESFQAELSAFDFNTEGRRRNAGVREIINRVAREEARRQGALDDPNSPILVQFADAQYVLWIDGQSLFDVTQVLVGEKRRVQVGENAAANVPELKISIRSALCDFNFRLWADQAEPAALQRPEIVAADDVRKKIIEIPEGAEDEVVVDETPATDNAPSPPVIYPLVSRLEQADDGLTVADFHSFFDLLVDQEDSWPERMSLMSVAKRVFQGAERPITGADVLKAYAEALGRELPQFDTDPKPAEALRHYLEVHRQHILYDQSALSQALASNRLTELLDIFDGRPQLFMEALQLWREDVAPDVQFGELVKQYAGIVAEMPVSRPRLEDSEQRARFVDLRMRDVDADVSTNRDRDQASERFAAELEVMIRQSRREYTRDPQGLLRRLGDERAALTAERYPSYSDSTLARYQALYDATLQSFRDYHDFKVEGMRREPFAYHLEGIRFLMSRHRAILADEAGLGKTYQAIAALETERVKLAAVGEELGLVVWVTDTTNLRNVKNEVVKHSLIPESEVMIIARGDVKERRRQIRSLADSGSSTKYVIINFEQMVALHNRAPELYNILNGEETNLVGDEGQLLDNESSLRSQAVLGMSPRRTYFLMATPYQSDQLRIFTLLNNLDPKSFPDFDRFVRDYPANSEGAAALHRDTRHLILRRNKAEVIAPFEDPAVVPFADQLADGAPRRPNPVVRKPIRVRLSRAQTEISAWMLSDFRGWAAHYNSKVPHAPIDLTTINPLIQLLWLRKVIDEPAKVGLRPDIGEAVGPDAPVTEKRVRRFTDEGKKVIVWIYNTSVVKKLAEQYADLNPALVYGGATVDRDAELERFKNDPSCQILIMSYLVGSMGINVSSAHEAVAVQLPPAYPRLYQMSHRHDRVISAIDGELAKYEAGMTYVVHEYDPEVVAGIKDDRLRAVMSRGTITEQTLERLSGAEIIYRIFLEGYREGTDPDQFMNGFLLQGLRYDDEP